MKNVLSVFLIVGMTIIIQVNSFSQKQDSLIQLYPGIGDTLYYFDKEYFELFQTVKGFKYAVFYIRDNKEFVSKVTLKSDGILKDTITTYSLSSLENVRVKIKKNIEGNNNRLNSPRKVMIYTKDKGPYSGLLEMFSKEYLYLLSNDHNDYRYKIPASNVNRIFILSESKVEFSTGLGALLGLAIGAVIGFITTNENELLGKEGGAATYGAIGGLVGAILGLIVGLSDSESDQEIKIENNIEILKLKNIAYYNFTYNESREKSYVTIQ